MLERFDLEWQIGISNVIARDQREHEAPMDAEVKLVAVSRFFWLRLAVRSRRVTDAPPALARIMRSLALNSSQMVARSLL